MGREAAFVPAKLVIGMLYSPRFSGFVGPCGGLSRALEEGLGPVDARGPDLDFRWSSYYDEEMGGRPRRGFFSFSRLVDPAELADIKLMTNSLERAFAEEGRRPLNLDPGLLSLPRFTLATTKDRPHRIPLHRGIYAELTLVYRGGEYRSLPWTYPDWASEEYRGFLRELRAGLKRSLGESSTQPHAVGEGPCDRGA